MSKTILCVSILFLVSANIISSPQQTAGELFEKALYMEEGRGDLRKAIDLYQQILKQFPENREYAAMAQLHIALCYEKLGSEDVQAAYQKVIENYPDQTEAVKAAIKKLAIFLRAQEKVKKKAKIYRFQYAEPVWTGPDVNLLASPSPDSQYLSYIDEAGRVAVRDLSTGKTRRLTNENLPSQSSEFPSITRWSPDGKQIVYNRQSREHLFELRTVELRGSKPRLLYRDDEVIFIRPYDWSQDGRSILVILTRADKKNQVALISAEDGSPTLLKTLNEDFPKNMSFSPDGRYIVYDYPTEEDIPKRDIFILPADGSQEIQIVKHQADDFHPFWVSDGRRIIFLSDRTEPLGVWCVHVTDDKVERAPIPLRLNFGTIIPTGFTRKGSFFFSYATMSGEGVFSGEVTKIENYFPVITSIDHDEPKLMNATHFGGPGNEHGTGIAIFENNIYLSGWRTGDKSEGLVAKYSFLPDQAPQMGWSIFWPSKTKTGMDNVNEFSDISVTAEGIYVAGKGTSLANDDVGSLEHKSYLVKFPYREETEAIREEAVWYQCPNFFPYGGFEYFFTVLASQEKNQTSIFTAGCGQANWANDTAVLSKYDNSGNLLWWKTLGDTEPQTWSICNDVVRLHNNLYIAGMTQKGTQLNSRKAALWKYDPEGNLLWQTVSPEKASMSWGITTIGDNIYVTGETETDIFIHKYDENGNLLWNTLVCGAHSETSFDIASDGNLLFITGKTRSIGPWKSNIFLLEVDPKDGTVLSFNIWGGADSDTAKGIAVNGRDIYIVGETSSTESGDSDLVLLWFKK